MSAPILVTGASGNTGREVLRALRERALPFRAGVRRTGAPPEVALDFRGPRTWDEALQGCRGVFFLRPPAIADVEETLLPFVDRARTLGAEQVVFLSVAGAEKNSFVPHHAVEKHLQAKEAPFTILRPGFFAQNLQDAYLREDDRLIVPAGRAGPPSSICTTSPTWPPGSSPSPPRTIARATPSPDRRR